MRYRLGRWLQGIVLVTLAPGAGWGQPVARSLEELQALMTAAYASCNDNCDAPDPIPMFLSAAGFGAGIGALAGFLVDKAHKGRELLYPAPGRSPRSINVSPILSTNHKGLSVWFRF